MAELVNSVANQFKGQVAPARMEPSALGMNNDPSDPRIGIRSRTHTLRRHALIRRRLICGRGVTRCIRCGTNGLRRINGQSTIRNAASFDNRRASDRFMLTLQARVFGGLLSIALDEE
jgi:hypothetical protein